MIRSVRSFLEFCYIARRSEHFPATIEGMQDACSKFWQYREIFRSVPGVLKKDFNLPRQHSMLHYERHIWNFGAPSGLCTSITESKHIKAVKEPWRRSNRYEALGQMLLTNQRMDKLAMSRVHYEEQGMLVGTCLQAARLELGTSHPRTPHWRCSHLKGCDIDPTLPAASAKGSQGKKSAFRKARSEGRDGAVDQPDILASVKLAQGVSSAVTTAYTAQLYADALEKSNRPR